MFPIMTNEGGQCMAFPDVCKTPTPAGPVPIPYPNMAMGTDGEGSKKVKIKNKEVLRKGDQIRMSSGDEAGSAQGVASNKIKGKTEFLMGWPKVKAEGKEVAFQTAPTGQNGASLQNIPGGIAALQSQTTVKTYMMVRGKKRLVAQKVDTYKTNPPPKTVAKSPDMDDKAKAAKRARKKKSKRSEELGEAGGKNAAQEWAKQNGGLEYMEVFEGSGTLDIVAKASGPPPCFLVLECKGGGSPLGTRITKNYGRCQQGTPGYLDDIVDNMAKNTTDPKKSTVGQELRDQIDSDPSKVTYAEARTSYDKNGSDDTEVKEFDP